jgi:hypothetical protein
MKREAISKEVLKHINFTTGYTSTKEEDTLDSVNFDETDIIHMTMWIFNSLQLSEEQAETLLQDSEEIYLQGTTISDYIDAVYDFIHK